MSPWRPKILRPCVASLAVCVALTACQKRRHGAPQSEPTLSSVVGGSDEYRRGTMVIAGGGTEGEIGDQESWSYRLLRALIVNCDEEREGDCRRGGADGKTIVSGDVNGDGIVQIAVLAATAQDAAGEDWYAKYLEWIGQTLGQASEGRPLVKAKTLVVPDRTAANSPKGLAFLEGADAVFLKGGDQSDYHGEWDGTLLETFLHEIIEVRGGAFGGTSAGAMSLSEFAFVGGNLTTAIALADASAHEFELPPPRSGSGIVSDFFPVLKATLIDTHFDQRARLGRLLALLGKASEEQKRSDLLGIGLSVATGLVVRGRLARVVGNYYVTFAQLGDKSELVRTPKKPPLLTDARIDVLTDGWVFDLVDRAVSSRPKDARLVTVAGPKALAPQKLEIDADKAGAMKVFAWTGEGDERDSRFYRLSKNSCDPCLEQTVGFVNADDRDDRRAKMAAGLRALYEERARFAIFLFPGTLATVDGKSLSVAANEKGNGAAALILDASPVTYQGLAPTSPASGEEDLQLAPSVALEGVRAHLFFSSATEGNHRRFDLDAGRVVKTP